MFHQPIVKEFIELVKIDVASKEERVIANVLKDKLIAIGFTVEEDFVAEKLNGSTGNIIAKLKGNVPSSPILFSAHMDRVQNGKKIKPVIEDGIIKSDGTTILAADDVAGIVAILDGVRKVKSKGLPHGDIEILLSVCEEIGVQGTKFLDYSQLKSKIAFVMDSSGRLGKVVHKAPSKYMVRIEFLGMASHAGNEPEKGINAIKIASKALSEISEGRISPRTTSNFGVIRGGTTTNVICDYVEVLGEIRGTDKGELSSYIDYVKVYFKEIEKTYDTKINVQIQALYEGFEVSSDHKILEILSKAMVAVDVKCTLSSGGGGMDANRFNNNGITSVGIATGYINNHTKKEMVYVDDLIKAGELVQQIILEASNY